MNLGLNWSRPRGRLGWCLREAKGSVKVQSPPTSPLSMFLCSDSPHSEPGTIDEVDHDNGTEPHTSDEGEWGQSGTKEPTLVLTYLPRTAQSWAGHRTPLAWQVSTLSPE